MTCNSRRLLQSCMQGDLFLASVLDAFLWKGGVGAQQSQPSQPIGLQLPLKRLLATRLSDPLPITTFDSKAL
jgi:hypothetical protein